VPRRETAILMRARALASTLLAGLELEREGAAALAQDKAFGPVRIAPS
jgi:chromatin segregation and condensation protein Rec8/ScpA/Scc1 (kleisin family)